MNYIIYNKIGEILRIVDCPPKLAASQVKKKEFIMQGTADDAKQKIVNGQIVNKTAAEIALVDPNPPQVAVPHEDRLAYVTNKKWDDVLERLKKLETKT